MTADLLPISADLQLPHRELRFTFSRSRGAGGQNVNKVNSRVTLHFDVEHSPTLTADQRLLLRTRLGGRIGNDGQLQISVDTARTQGANRDLAVARFCSLLAEALQPSVPRRPTRIGRAARERRKIAKIRHSRRKSERTWNPSQD